MSKKTLIEEIKIEEEIKRRRLQKDFYAFVCEMWPLVEPETPFVEGWHIKIICKHLEAVKDFRIKKLAINIPPRHMKSTLCAVLFPAWVWTTDPSKKFIYGSYAEHLALRDAVKTRELITSEHYRKLFKIKWDMADDSNQKKEYKNTKGGSRVSVGVGSGLTGKGADYLFIDDPLNAQDILSSAAIEGANHWHDVAFSTRYNDAKRHAKVIIMQRLHGNDLTGHVLEEDSYEHLVMAAEYDPDSEIISRTGLKYVDPRHEKGELLWPAKFDADAIADLRKSLKMHAEAQLNQEPKLGEGGLFPRDRWQVFEVSPSPILDCVQFWDCAEKPGITNDYSVCATWARTLNGYFLLDIWRDKVDAPTLVEQAKILYRNWQPSTVAVEDKSHGTTLIQYLLRETTIPVLPIQATKSKELRAISATSAVKSRRCHLPKDADFVKDFIKEHERFPKGKHDDQVDTTSMAVNYFNESEGDGPKLRSL